MFRKCCAIAVVTCLASTGWSADAPFVPGTGVRVMQVGDDFEDPTWGYTMNGAKASYEQDEEQRPPGGRSRNGRWYESAMRGQPDLIKRVKTPPDGLPGSAGALLLRTRLSGIPGELAGKQMQDDLLMGVMHRLGRPVPVAWSPSFTVRVFLPPFDKWEDRTGASFGIRGDCRGINTEGELEAYWPGYFILFRSETSKEFEEDFAQIAFRASKPARTFLVQRSTNTAGGPLACRSRQTVGSITMPDPVSMTSPQTTICSAASPTAGNASISTICLSMLPILKTATTGRRRG